MARSVDVFLVSVARCDHVISHNPTRLAALGAQTRHSPPLGQCGAIMLPPFPGRKPAGPLALSPGNSPGQPSQHGSDRAVLEAVIGSDPLSDDEGRNAWRGAREGGTPPGSVDYSVDSGSIADSYGSGVADGPGSQPTISLQRRNADTRDASPAPKQRRGAAKVTLMPADSS